MKHEGGRVWALWFSKKNGHSIHTKLFHTISPDLYERQLPLLSETRVHFRRDRYWPAKTTEQKTAFPPSSKNGMHARFSTLNMELYSLELQKWIRRPCHTKSMSPRSKFSFKTLVPDYSSR